MEEITKFENFGLATACLEASSKQEVMTLSLRSAHLGAELMVDPIRELLSGALGVPTSASTPEINIEVGVDRIGDPNVPGAFEVPECLQGVLMNDDMNPTDYLQDKLSEFTSGSRIDMSLSFVTDALSISIDPLDMPIFIALDSLDSYLTATYYIDSYNDWLELTNCIMTNCPEIKNSIRTNDFMYVPETNRFIVPVSFSSKRILLRKFFGEISRKQAKDLVELEGRYYDYLRDKRSLINKAKDQLTSLEIADSLNPFADIDLPFGF